MQTREEYIKEYQDLGQYMFTHCVTPTVYDFVQAFKNNDKDTLDKIKNITEYTGNTDDIIKSSQRRLCNYSEDESRKFMKSVIAANLTDITSSGYFYKKLISSCDDMTIEVDDCGSGGQEFVLPLTANEFDYKIKDRWVEELGKFVEDFNELPKEGNIHVRTFLTCKHDPNHRHFCKKCAGLFRRSYESDTFTPKNIGIYSTYMITEHATQASLDSMNKGTTDSLNAILERKIGKVKNFEQAKTKIEEVIDSIGNVGVESRFYEIALLSRLRDGQFSALVTSFLKQEDKLGAFMYQPNKTQFDKLLLSKEFEANSMKTKIAFDKYD